MTEKRLYFSMRNSDDPTKLRFDLPMLNRLFLHTFKDFFNRDYFQESMGFICVDEGYIAGTMGEDMGLYGLMKLKKSDIFPIKEDQSYQEEDIFDLIEFLHDHVSKPTKGEYHQWDQCGWHYHEFDRLAGQTEFREHINEFLSDYGEGWSLESNGEIVSVGEDGLSHLFEAEIPHDDKENINERINQAVRKFRRYKSTIQDRRDAVRDLADVLEFLRPQAKQVLLDSDERDLFNLANNFGIRHHNSNQKTQYDQSIWLSWMFYYYLATIHATIRLIDRSDYTGKRGNRT